MKTMTVWMWKRMKNGLRCDRQTDSQIDVPTAKLELRPANNNTWGVPDESEQLGMFYLDQINTHFIFFSAQLSGSELV